MYNLPLTLLKNDNGTYTVISNLFNIVTEGNTLEEAISNGKEALECHIGGLEKGDDDYAVLKSLDGAFNTSVLI